ncbi:MAG TPA: AMP-binding protein, partial [Candidatus Acidoferrum sp.]|nr:AMP-binding protein [Candidatus Acidoferrum sp.]
HGEEFVSVTGQELLELVQHIRAQLRSIGLQLGDRCALLAANSIRWAACDLALMAEGVIVVPLYVRQAPAELAAMMRDCRPRLLLTRDAALGEAVSDEWRRNGDGTDAPRCILLDELLGALPASAKIDASRPPVSRADADIVTIIYTSGTSGEPKGVCLNVGNVTYMLSRTTERLNQLMGATREPDRIFHYLPFNFCASWIALLSFLSRDSTVTLSTDLNRVAEEIALAAPHYFLNVPTLLERVKRGVDAAFLQRPAPIQWLFAKARTAWQRKKKGSAGPVDALWLELGRRLIFSKIKGRFGAYLRALICGSAPLTSETQEFFAMLDIPVLQVYGLTETTGICTMDDPRVAVEPGYVGPAIPGMEMRVAENDEIAVRGPNVFAGYWNRPEETARALRDGWFHTGDQGAVNERGNWRITGRLKNLIILNSGHNVAPEPIEDKIAARLPQAQQVVLVGNGRGYLCALLTGTVDRVAVQSALDGINAELPHYRQIRNFTILPEAFTPESGLLTAMGKIRRDAINARYQKEISTMYEQAQTPVVSAAGQR